MSAFKEYVVRVYENRTEWLLNGKLHREDGPAVECVDGSKEWYLNDELHREDGPAVECVDGSKAWFINDQRLTESEFNSRTQVKELSVSEIQKLLGYKIKVIE